MEQIGEGITIIIPAFNEELAIGKVLIELVEVIQSAATKYEVIVVDDGSSDKTVETVEQFPVEIFQHPTNLGYGAALKTGIINAQNEIICIMDADGTYPVKEIPNLANHLIEKDLDMVVGARVNENVAIPAIRKPAKWVIGQLAKLSVGAKIPDINSGFGEIIIPSDYVILGTYERIFY